ERLPPAPARHQHRLDAAGVVAAAPRGHPVLHPVLTEHGCGARLHLTGDDPCPRVLPRRREAHRQRPDRRGEGMTDMTTSDMTTSDQTTSDQRTSDTTTSDRTTELWRDAGAPVADRVEALVAALTLEEKVAQLHGIWIAASNDGAEVAPNQNDMIEDMELAEVAPLGLGQLTRTYGTAPVDPAAGAVSLLRSQRRIVSESRFGIPALAHEECLAGFAAWGATAYPVPLSWGATFSPELVQRMGERIGADMRKMGIHQGLAPVLDVVRDARWGRVEETIGEDPYLVGTTASA